MCVAVIGGTGFIGRAIAGNLEAAVYAVLVVHGGQQEHDIPGPAHHAHLDRHDVLRLIAALTTSVSLRAPVALV